MKARVMACPPWCATDHDSMLDVDDLRYHGVEILSVETLSGPEVRASVDVTVYDDLAAGTRGAGMVSLAAEDGLTPDAARRLAFAILEAAELAESGGSR